MAALESAELQSATTISAGMTTPGIDVSTMTEAMLYIDVTNVTAGNVTVKAQVSPNNSDWFDYPSGGSGAIAVAGNTAIKLVNCLGKYLRADITVTTGPVTLAIWADCKDDSVPRRQL